MGVRAASRRQGREASPRRRPRPADQRQRRRRRPAGRSSPGSARRIRSTAPPLRQRRECRSALCLVLVMMEDRAHARSCDVCAALRAAAHEQRSHVPAPLSFRPLAHPQLQGEPAALKPLYQQADWDRQQQRAGEAAPGPDDRVSARRHAGRHARAGRQEAQRVRPAGARRRRGGGRGRRRRPGAEEGHADVSGPGAGERVCCPLETHAARGTMQPMQSRHAPCKHSMRSPHSKSTARLQRQPLPHLQHGLRARPGGRREAAQELLRRGRAGRQVSGVGVRARAAG
jgi:hypothetical protein